MSVYLVWVRLGNACHVLKAFRTRKAAEAHVERCTAYREDREGHALLSHAEMLGASAMWVEELPVEER
jgi:hypothetical protein